MQEECRVRVANAALYDDGIIKVESYLAAFSGILATAEVCTAGCLSLPHVPRLLPNCPWSPQMNGQPLPSILGRFWSYLFQAASRTPNTPTSYPRLTFSLRGAKPHIACALAALLADSDAAEALDSVHIFQVYSTTGGSASYSKLLI